MKYRYIVWAMALQNLFGSDICYRLCTFICRLVFFFTDRWTDIQQKRLVNWDLQEILITHYIIHNMYWQNFQVWWKVATYPPGCLLHIEWHTLCLYHQLPFVLHKCVLIFPYLHNWHCPENPPCLEIIGLHPHLIACLLIIENIQ